MTSPAPGTYGGGGYGEGPYGGGAARAGIYSRALEDAYARLPDFYREADVDGVLKRWLAAIFDQVGEMRELRERFALDPTPVVLQPTGEQLRQSAAGLPVTGQWTAVPTSGGVGLSTDGPSASLEWQATLEGGDYQLLMSWQAGPDRGIVRVEVDGLSERTLDTWAPTLTEARDVTVLQRVTLPRGFHTVRVHWTGAKRADSGGTTVVVTALGLTNLVGQRLDVSDLVDPNTADSRWLPWLGQLVGAKLQPGMDAAQRRDTVRQATQLRSGSHAALVAAVRSVLTGTRTVAVYPHTAVDIVGTRIPGSPWDLTVVTTAGESPSTARVLAAVQRLDAKPAGVRLHHAVYAGSWAAFHTRYPTWAAIHEQNTWARLQEAMLDGSTPTPTAGGAARLLAPAKLRANPTTSGAIPTIAVGAVLRAPAALTAASTEGPTTTSDGTFTAEFKETF